MVHVASSDPQRDGLCYTLDRNRACRADVERIDSTMEELDFHTENFCIWNIFFTRKRLFSSWRSIEKTSTYNAIVRRDRGIPSTLQLKLVNRNFFQSLSCRIISDYSWIRVCKAFLSKHQSSSSCQCQYSSKYLFHYFASPVDDDDDDPDDDEELESPKSMYVSSYPS